MTQPTVAEALEGAANMAVLGTTQTGKTAFCRELHAESPRVSIWVNERGDRRVPNVEGVECRALDDVAEAFRRDRYRIEYLPSDRREAYPRLRRWLWRVADAADRELPVQVVCDEADRVAEQTHEKDVPPRDATRMFTSEGMKRNIKHVSITQHPQGFDKESLRNAHLRAVFPMTPEARRSVSKYGFDWDRVDSAGQYTGVLHHYRHGPLGEVRAAGRFA